MKNQIVIPLSVFEELKSLIDDLQCFLASVDPECQEDISTLFKQDLPEPTEEELRNIF